MKLYRNAIILVVIVALLGCAYYFLNRSKNTGDNTDTSTDDIIKILDYTTDNIKSVTLKNSEGTFVIVKKDTNWVLSSPTDFTADSSVMSGIVINAATVIADKVIEENAADLAQYGLDKPVDIMVSLNDGKEKTLQIGNLTPTKGSYYVKLKDSSKIYTVSTYTAEQLLVKRNDMKDKVLFTIKSEDIIAFSMDRKGGNVFKSKKTSESEWSMLEPIQGSTNTSALGPMLDAITQTGVSKYIEEKPSDLNKYGLGNPSYVFEFETSSQKYKLLMGSEETKGSQIYAMLEGRNEVFTIDETAYNFIDKPLKEIIDVFAYIVNIDQVNKIELTMDGKTTTMGLDVFKDAEGKSDSDKDKFTVNGKDASMKDKDDKQPFRNFYQSLIGISLDEIDPGVVPAGTPEVSITYYLKSAPGTMKVDFISKDADYYYVMRNGQYAGILVRKVKQDYGIGGMKTSYKTMMDAVDAQK